MAKLLFLCKRDRPDIQTAVAFMCMRVKPPDKDDWKKLKRCVAYLRGSIGLVMTVGRKTDVLRVWIDASFAVHPNMKS